MGLFVYFLAGSTIAFSAEQTELAAAAPASANLSLSVRTPDRRAAWQQKLTLGPGES